MSEMDEQFRDSIATINEAGKRAWIFPKKPSGRLYTYRKWVSYLLLAFLFSAPFIKINGNQFLLFNVLQRRFNIFGFPFWPQDFHLFVISMIIGVIFVALFTVAFGRIFCGWMCPQTIFLEMVFRRIEYWIDGDRGAQMRLAKMPWNGEKIRKRLLKWFVFFVVSFLIANIFLAYLISSDTLLEYITEGPSSHLGTLTALLIFTGVFYFIFAWFREQVCIIACPYGRMQGVLLDNKSVVVAYDHKRGEGENGRKKFKKGEDRQAQGYGDCIDCNQCVHVCPTGIDIRNGTQLECVNCTACIDECDTIMEKISLPKGLIRYASEDEIVKKERFRFTARMKGYAAVLVILIGTLIGMLFLRNDLEATILRLPGQLYQRMDNNRIRNVYTYKLINKTTHEVDNVSFKLLSHPGEITFVTGAGFPVPAENLAEGTVFVDIKTGALNGDDDKLEIGVFSGDQLIETASVRFLAPRTYK
jgi:cytochrome c oxidase accessory protein FixG